jgi:hypothetical protein
VIEPLKLKPVSSKKSSVKKSEPLITSMSGLGYVAVLKPDIKATPDAKINFPKKKNNPS